ncbi:MAG: hypothetical protein Q9162_004183 [Coniocarpon cinnabarinum]
MSSNERSSETTPLLNGSHLDANHHHLDAAEPPVAVIPDSPAVAQQVADGAHLERQDTREDRQRQYEGIPEVRQRMGIMFPAMSIGVFLAAADQTLIVSSYGRIGTDLRALNKTSWVATGYFLTLTSFQPLYGKLSDIFGRKSCLLTAYLIFGLGCLGCGLARDINQLVGARAFAGIGGGGMTTVVSILLSDAIPLQERGQWQGYINIVYASGGSIGAPLGGLLADSIGWRWSFLAQVPACLLAFAAVGTTLKLPQQEKSNMMQKLRRIDFLGAAVLVCAVLALLVGLDRGSNLSWTDPVTLSGLIISFVLSCVWLLVEVKVASEPIAPVHIMFQRTLTSCHLCNYFSFAGWLAALFYLSLYYQGYYGASSTRAGVLMIPQIISGVSGSLFAGFTIRRTGKYYWLNVAGYLSMVAGMIIILFASGLLIHSIPATISGAMITGFGNGIGVTSSLIALIANAKRDDQAVATACLYLFRTLGSTTGVSLSATVFNQTLRRSLSEALGSGEAAGKVQEAVRRSLSTIRDLEPGIRRKVRDSYGMGADSAFAVELGLVCGAAIAAWFIRQKPLH